MKQRSIAIVGGLVAALALGSILFPDTMPAGIMLKGALFGSATGLLAVGLVLTYRTTRIINFSYGAMGSLGGGLAAALAEGKGWNWGQAALAGIATGVVAGALVERLIVRRFANAPRLVLTVATIGLAQLLGGLAIYLPSWLDAPAFIPQVETSLTDSTVNVGPVTFTGNDLLLLAVVPIVLAVLSWFLLRTEAGMAVRGMAENMDRARLLGIPVNQLSLLLWSVAGGLAALTVVLRAPTEGVPLTAVAGPTVLLPALAAAVIVGMRSMSGAFLAGVLLGVLDQLVLWNVDEAAPTSVVLLAVIVVALLLQRRSGHRAETSESSWSVVGVGHGLARTYAQLREVRTAKAVLAGLVVVAVLALPVLGSDSQVNFGTITLAYGLVALSLVVLTGWGGVVSLGQVAVMGTGAVVTANLIADRNVDLFVCLVLSGVAGGVIALLLGLPALRVSGQFLAVTTLAFAVAMELYFLNPANYERWMPAAYERPELWGVLELSNERWLYALAVVLVGGGRVHRPQPQGGPRRAVDLGHPRQRAGRGGGRHQHDRDPAGRLHLRRHAGRRGRRPARRRPARHRAVDLPGVDEPARVLDGRDRRRVVARRHAGRCRPGPMGRLPVPEGAAVPDRRRPARHPPRHPGRPRPGVRAVARPVRAGGGTAPRPRVPR